MCIHIYLSKYNLQRLRNIPCMCVFWTDRLVLENQLMCFSLENTALPTLCMPQSPIVLPVVLRPVDFPLQTLTGLLVSLLFSSCLGSHCLLFISLLA